MSQREPADVTRDQAKEIVDNAPFGFIVTGGLEPMPLLGDSDVDKLKFEVTVEAYRFGDIENLEI